MSVVEIEAELNSLGQVLRDRRDVAQAVRRELSDARPLVSPPGQSCRIDASSRIVRGAAAACCALVLMGLVICLAVNHGSVTWADMAEVVRRQPWIHATASFPNGAGEVWFSPTRNVSVWKTPDQVVFRNGPERWEQTWRKSTNTIVQLPIGEERIPEAHWLTALQSDSASFGALFGKEQVVSQVRREVVTEGQRWVEFEFRLSRGSAPRGILRVDPETRLPRDVRLFSPDEETAVIEWRFDYPETGPEDLYALGVPRSADISRPAPAELSEILARMADSRARLDDFWCVAASEPGLPSSLVRRQGDRWRIDLVVSFIREWDPPSPDSPDWSDWWQERVAAAQSIPSLRSDGTQVLRNSNPVAGRLNPNGGPTWTAEGSLSPDALMHGRPAGWNLLQEVYPDLSPHPGWTYRVENVASKSGDALVQVKRSTESTLGGMAHEWYTLDPRKGYAVVAAELFMLPPAAGDVRPEASEHRQTVSLESFVQASSGFWYPRIVRDRRPRVTAAPQPGKTLEVRGDSETVTYYELRTDLELPDDVFAGPE